MLDIGWSELFFTVAVAIVVIGPRDMPRALRFAGQWLGRIRRVSAHFRSGIEAMIQEAELQEMEKRWQEQNAAIMAAGSPESAPQNPENPLEPGPDHPAAPVIGPDAQAPGHAQSARAQDRPR